MEALLACNVMIMQGGARLGKTELSHILANEMGMLDGLHEQLAQNIMNPIDLHAFLLSPRSIHLGWDVDERVFLEIIIVS